MITDTLKKCKCLKLSISLVSWRALKTRCCCPMKDIVHRPWNAGDYLYYIIFTYSEMFIYLL